MVSFFVFKRQLIFAGWVAFVTSFSPPPLAKARHKRPFRSTTAADTLESLETATISSISAWDHLAGNVTNCLLQSDFKRNDGRDGASTGWTSWVDEASSSTLRNCLDHLVADLSATSFQWILSSPASAMVDISPDLHDAVLALGNENGSILSDIDCGEELSNSTVPDLIPRIACHLYFLPSGATLDQNLQSPPGSMIHGKLLLGGVTRFRLLKGRRVGERMQIVPSDQNDAPPESWLQYGGPERNYQAVDMGPCLFLELTLLPTGLEIEDPTVTRLSSFPQDPQAVFQLVSPVSHVNNSNHDGNDVYNWDLSRTLGGLDNQMEQIVRRVLDGRVFRPASRQRQLIQNKQENGEDGDQALTDDALVSSVWSSSEFDDIRRQEMQDLSSLGLDPVRGLLLYGPPGCGKTALAREISNALNAVPPKIVSAPELLDRWVGGSERLIRELFVEAEQELKMCGGDVSQSALHVIIIDEIDAVFRRRSAGDGSAEVTRASAVNQILAKLDGVQQLDNILVIGMTNRKELLDPALLRPGRLEVHVEIPLPNADGRREILQIQFAPLRRRGRLSQPLCDAIDGINTERTFWTRSLQDLADDRWTGGWSGADLAGLVRSSGSFALARTRKQGGSLPDDLLITLEDVRLALEEVKF